MKEPFLVALANPEPSPGGGAAAGYSACLGVALLKKIIHLELLRSRVSVELTSYWQDMRRRSIGLEKALEELMEEDGKAYQDFIEARSDCRSTNTAVALEKAIECPVKIMKQSCEGLEIISEMGRSCGRHLLADLLVSGEVFLAAVKGASHIAWSNIRLLPGNLLLTPAISTGEIALIAESCQEKYELVQEQLRNRITTKKIPVKKTC